MSESTNKKSLYVAQTTQVAESAKFTGILGSNVNPKWFEWLMTHAGTYLFSIALFLYVLKFGISVYQFIKSPNKNINANSSLGWSAFQTAIIGTAIVGTLAAAAVFALVTPVLFVTAMALDTLRNIGLLFWNIGKLASLKYLVGKSEDSLSQIKYEALKNKYIEKIKQHAKGSVVGLVMTTAISIIFLFPHIGLGAVAAASVVIGGIKLTVAGIAGIAAGAALTIPLIPTIYKFSKWGLSKIGNGIQNLFSFFKSKLSKPQSNIPDEKQEIEEQPLNQNVIPIRPNIPTKHLPNFKIDTNEKVEQAIQHKLDFSAFSLHSQFRETIIDHIENKSLAIKALQKMVNDKIPALVADLKKGQTSGYHYFTEKQRPKREQKLFALLSIKQQLNNLLDAPNENILEDYKESFKNSTQITKSFVDASKLTLSELIHYIESSLPGVKESFFLEQSDTQNIIEALNVFVYKFPESRPVANMEI